MKSIDAWYYEIDQAYSDTIKAMHKLEDREITMQEAVEQLNVLESLATGAVLELRNALEREKINQKKQEEIQFTITVSVTPELKSKAGD